MMWAVAIVLCVLAGLIVAWPLGGMRGLIAGVMIGGAGLGLYALIGAPNQDGSPANDADATMIELAQGAEILRQRLYEEKRALPTEAFAGLALAYEQLGRPRAAAIVWRDAAVMQPEQISHYEGLLRALLMADQGFITAQTKQVLDQILQRDGAHQAARLGLARYYQQEGDVQKALPIMYGIADELEKNAPVRFGVISQIWKMAVDENVKVPARFLPPPAMRDRLREQGIDLPLPDAETPEAEMEVK